MAHLHVMMPTHKRRSQRISFRAQMAMHSEKQLDLMLAISRVQELTPKATSQEQSRPETRVRHLHLQYLQTLLEVVLAPSRQRMAYQGIFRYRAALRTLSPGTTGPAAKKPSNEPTRRPGKSSTGIPESSQEDGFQGNNQQQVDRIQHVACPFRYFQVLPDRNQDEGQGKQAVGLHPQESGQRLRKKIRQC